MRERAGIIMDYATTAAVTAGVPVIVGTVVGVPNKTFAANADGNLVALECEGVFELGKDTAAIEQGVKVYLTSAGVITATATGNTLAGIAWNAATADDTKVFVKINA